MRHIHALLQAHKWNPVGFASPVLRLWDTDGNTGRLNINCLAWTAHYETATFSIYDDIDEATQHLWFEEHFPGIGFGNTFHVIYKIKFRSDLGYNCWRLEEKCNGRIRFVNENPFDPRKDLSASNTAKSAYKVNQGHNYHPTHARPKYYSLAKFNNRKYA